MANYPRRGSRLLLECSCDGRVTDWAITPWADRLYAVSIVTKGDRCPIRRHHPGTKLSVRARLRARPPKYYDTLGA
jgi:hypothetical protein